MIHTMSIVSVKHKVLLSLQWADCEADFLWYTLPEDRNGETSLLSALPSAGQAPGAGSCSSSVVPPGGRCELCGSVWQCAFSSSLLPSAPSGASPVTVMGTKCSPAERQNSELAIVLVALLQ